MYRKLQYVPKLVSSPSLSDYFWNPDCQGPLVSFGRFSEYPCSEDCIVLTTVIRAVAGCIH